MLTILDRYLFKEILLSFGAILFVLLVIIIGQLFVKLLNKVIEGNIPVETVFPLLGLVVIKAVIQLMPAALLLGVMFAMGRLYRDSEIAALRACGFGFTQIYRPLVMLAIPLVTLLAILVLYVLPLTVRMADQMQYRAEHSTNISGIAAGQFIESNIGNWVVFVESAEKDRGLMSNVFIHGVEKGRTIIETAEKATYDVDPDTGRRLLKLHNGHRYEDAPQNGNYQLVSFATHTIKVPVFEVITRLGGRDTKPTAELLESDEVAYKAELQRRISVPITAFILVLLALPLSYTTPRRGRFAKLVVGIVVYIVYSNLVNLSIGLIESNKLPVWIGVWWAHLLMLLFTVSLFAWQNGLRWTMGWIMPKKK